MDRRSRDEGGDSEPCRSAGDEVHVTWVRPQLDVAITITLKQISCTFSGYI